MHWRRGRFASARAYVGAKFEADTAARITMPSGCLKTLRGDTLITTGKQSLSKTVPKIIGIAILAVGLAACSDGGGSSSNDLDAEEAAQAFATAFATVGEALSDMQDAAPDTATAAGCTNCPQLARVEFDYDFDCPQSGDIEMSGGVDTDALFDFDLDLDFNECESNNIVIDGNIDYEGEGVLGSYSYSMDGQLDFSGDVNGSCDIDFEVECDGGDCDFSGSFCGEDIDV